ncbi:unnamed protein product [Caenorhabditis auriculariae]|uniref:Ig-like domain-containing protein n=1 Tax=Caenorhabditis auriculariae TaxID=2777116 RepID=A0A8S1HD49_9PELO|nr:unnamed protein product [Caenorhabditis auriculariae]
MRAPMSDRLRLMVILLLAISSEGSPSDRDEPKKKPSEQLVPVGATTALMCEPAFVSDSKATWFRDGSPVATVSNHSNAIYQNRSPTAPAAEKLPEVGFLTIFNVSKEDQGTYWCRRETDGQFGEVFNLQVAFLDVPTDFHITLSSKHPKTGESFYAHCPIPEGFPTPRITWTVNEMPMSHVSSDFEVFANGTLHLPRMSFHHFGTLECRALNFAGKAIARTFVSSRELHPQMESIQMESIGNSLRGSFHSACFMFLMGCLATCACVLIYLLGVVCLMRRRPRLTLRPTWWSRGDPALAPGFRKAVVPLPDCFANARMLSPA